MEIRNYTLERTEETVKLFYSSVHAIDSTIYSDKQKQAWAPTSPDYAQWCLRLARNKTYLAIINNKVAGFIALELNGHIDCIFTHPEHEGKGVACLLYSNIEIFAKARNMEGLSIEASIVAKPFFERRGFVVQHKNRVEKSGQILTNFSMKKLLHSSLSLSGNSYKDALHSVTQNIVNCIPTLRLRTISFEERCPSTHLE
jgi:putative acetyltransferase